MKQTTQIGATVEEAISLALQKLDLTIEQVDVEVLQEGKRGFLGFGARPAEVRIVEKQQAFVTHEQSPTANEQIDELESIEENSSSLIMNQQDDESLVNPVEDVKVYLAGIAEGMGITDLTIHVTSHGKNTLFKLESEKAALLIGKRGQTLNAIQQLAQLVYNKSAQSFMNVKVDVENYRERRQESLEILAERMADKAIRTGKAVTLEPMPSYERKVIHNTLSKRLDIETYSEGKEPNRYLVIEPLK